MPLVRVALDVPLDRLFDYRLQDSQQASVGQRVIVPFGPGRRTGVVVEVGGETVIEANRLKHVEAVLHEEPVLPPDVLELCRFCAGYYHYPLGQIVMLALPPKLRNARSAPDPVDRTVMTTQAGREALLRIPARHKQQRTLLEFIGERASVLESKVRAALPAARAWLKPLEERGWIEFGPPVPAPEQDIQTSGGHSLTQDQAAAVAAVRGKFGSFASFLLLGITGSGKTEVYLQLIADVVRRGGQALMLVPEINLTPQLDARVRERFPRVRIASLHSDLSDTERLARWRLAYSGEARIVLGTRLAVFSALPNLELIIVDEEHDESFKQEEGLRYHARDLSLVRARRRNVPVLLASATPSLESYARAQAGRHELLRLPFRAAAQPPKVKCVDTRQLQLKEGLSEPLLRALSQRLANQEQSLIFINRRGYSPALLCYACGWMAQCIRCSARLVFHSKTTQLRCHYCGHQERVPHACEGCGNQDLRPRGHGTQRLELELARVFPSARIARVDRDTTQRKHAFATLRDLVHAQQVDILVGTQMLAKGHDFPNLTLVGIVNPDAALFSTDFRAAERLFALLIQVSGRAGRASIPGEVMIQTDFPHHPIYAAAERQDYEGFANALLEDRRATQFPPYSYQALLRAEAAERPAVDSFLALAASNCKEQAPEVEVFDPVPAPMARIAGKERGQLLVQSASRAALQTLLGKWRPWLAEHGGNQVRWHLDVDPRSV
ncbi:MAG: primosomal protein N' [Betaproteobacteria bacterium]|nr:primosomal protein N' [Betaproteobacteria bacterium]